MKASPYFATKIFFGTRYAFAAEARRPSVCKEISSYLYDVLLCIIITSIFYLSILFLYYGLLLYITSI